MVAGRPHRDSGLRAVVQAGSLSAVVVETGSASHAVLANCAITLNRVLTLGSAMR